MRETEIVIFVIFEELEASLLMNTILMMNTMMFYT